MRAVVPRGPYQELATKSADICDTVASDTISDISDRSKLSSILIKWSWDSCVTFLPTPISRFNTTSSQQMQLTCSRIFLC